MSFSVLLRSAALRQQAVRARSLHTTAPIRADHGHYHVRSVFFKLISALTRYIPAFALPIAWRTKSCFRTQAFSLHGQRIFYPIPRS